MIILKAIYPEIKRHCEFPRMDLISENEQLFKWPNGLNEWAYVEEGKDLSDHNMIFPNEKITEFTLLEFEE